MIAARSAFACFAWLATKHTPMSGEDSRHVTCRTSSGQLHGDIQDQSGGHHEHRESFQDERIDVRASAPVKQLLQEAARACHKNVSEVLLDAGVTAAAQTLADRRQFVLDEAQWQALQEALDRPVQSKPRLKKLLPEPGVLG
jgi:uncharacterized protein (DUF1778 family)